MVVDHDTGRLVWAAAGRDVATLGTFFDLLGEERCAQITHVSADSAAWIARVVTERCPDAIQCADPFHVVAWATDALDVVRREAWNAASGRRRVDPATGRFGIAEGISLLDGDTREVFPASVQEAIAAELVRHRSGRE